MELMKGSVHVLYWPCKSTSIGHLHDPVACYGINIMLGHKLSSGPARLSFVLKVPLYLCPSIINSVTFHWIVQRAYHVSSVCMQDNVLLLLKLGQ